jgi:hypothetical protein
MNKLIDGYAFRSEVQDKHEMNLYLGPCFDLTLSATEVIKIFDDRRKLRPGQSHAAPDATEREKPAQNKQPRCKK